ncbi:hypothetical protein MATL_G00042600 [Megalops atlanticus]|uniref:RING-type E3 ubiquitin transferase n=1 Tax=Megalops atlanticus TaxID=7932 RepID=A0A9D3QBA8_MEGAT|nr:hypothetical protein MATL_G00042600 [Megalops atlanticus]
MAAFSSAELGGFGRMEREQKNTTHAAGVGSGVETTVRQLTLEEARCPVCFEILLEPVTMPCMHSVCLPCFKRTVELTSLCCPLCRLRVSSWARRHSREKSLVNTELWDRVRQSYPERCKRRMEQREGETVGKEIIFRAPVHICKPGEIRQEYEKQKKKMEEEKEKGEKASEEAIHKSLENDQRQTGNQKKKTTCHKPVEPRLMPVTKEQEDKKKKHHHQRKEEFGTLKPIQDSVLGVLSDSENEEPIGKRTRHTSAFVRKTRSSSGSGRIVQSHVGQRSRSCTSTEEGRVRNSCLSRMAAVAKTSIAYSSNAGILLSSENSRSFSAPILAPDKRLAWRCVAGSAAPLMPPHSKPERSISPESNDSISEELNHFKPIVCSPCTPPKRLPDGRIVEPVIVKSTPRNLSQSFHKATSYEASPTILYKWKQIEMDRQCTRMTSKGTITSPISEDLIPSQSPGAMRSSRSPANVQDQMNSRDGVNSRPTSWRGRKKRQKTKHLEEAGRVKRPRPQSREDGDMEPDPSCLYAQRLQQEREDRELALKLQRQFNMESQMADRRKTSPDKYLLRSWSSHESSMEHCPRRSVRISQKKQAL